MRQQLIDLLALAILFLVVFSSILYAYFTGYWRDVVFAHTAGIFVLLLEAVDKKRSIK